MRSALPTLPAEELRINSVLPLTRTTVRKVAKTKSTRPIRRLHLAARQKTSEAEAGGVQAMIGRSVSDPAPLATLHWVGSVWPMED